MRELEEELETAHEMQMRLMPKEEPEIEGIELSGRCLSANHVGGDFFQYFVRGGKPSVCLADVTGHAMEAAVPVMMFSGVLRDELQYGHSLEKLYSNLTRILYDMLDLRTFVCFSMGEVEIPPARSNGDPPVAIPFRLANGGVPIPFTTG